MELLLAVLIDGHEAMGSRRALLTVRSGSGSAAGGVSEQHQRQRAPRRPRRPLAAAAGTSPRTSCRPSSSGA